MTTRLDPRYAAGDRLAAGLSAWRSASSARLASVRLLALVCLLAFLPRQSEAASASEPNDAPAAGMSLTFACPGDCDSDLEVKVNELILGVNIALGTTDLEACPEMDTGGNRSVDVDELVRAVSASLIGCASAFAGLLRNDGYSSTETAEILEASGYECAESGLALRTEFGADAWEVAGALKVAGYSCNAIDHAIQGLFEAVDSRQVMEDIGCDIEPIDPTTPGYAQLGSGYDVFTAYADTEFVKNRVLDLQALNQDEKLLWFPVDKFNVSQFQGTTISSYVNSLSASAGLSGSYGFFSGSINTTMSQMAGVTTEWSFATVQIKHRVHGLAVVKMQPVNLKPYLVEQFSDDINSDLDPSVLFDLYGTHVIGKLVVGGRLDYHLSALVTNEEQKRNIGVYAEAKFDSGFASLQLNTSFDYGTYRSTYVSNEDFTLSSVGGQGQASRIWTDGDYTQWVDTVWENPVFCDFGADPWLIPIWELADGGCEEGSRCWEIHEAYKIYAESQHIDIPGAGRKVLADIAVDLDIPSTQTGFEPLRDCGETSALAYVNRGVSSARTPTRQHDGIMEATRLWVSYKAVWEDQAIEQPINGIHLYTGGDDLERELAYGSHGLLKMKVGGVDQPANLSHDTCQQATYWHTNPCPTGLCAYSCDNVGCTTANTNRRELHYTRVGGAVTDPPIRSLVLADAVAMDKSKDFETRKKAIWWGPQDVNNDGEVNDTDAQMVLDQVVWVVDGGGQLLNVNQGAQNYYVYDYECPWGCCWVKTSITTAPAQYLGYVPYPD